MKDIAHNHSAWPFIEAQKILDHIGNKTPDKGYVLFETGYGPSGLPHIGTFGEVARTTMVRHAFSILAPDIPTKLFAFSDDMDGLRKVPENLPNQAMLNEYLGKPLTSIPDPYETHESFGHHMNQRLQQFLDHFGFDYTFKSATECYNAGLFDVTLRKVMEQYKTILNVILPTLGQERRATYSPFLPICPETGKVLQVRVEIVDVKEAIIRFTNANGNVTEQPVTGGLAKLQWKPDWGMRWAALGVDYEMHGKDLIPSAELSTQICQILGAKPPTLFHYELFLDENGQKISKSKGNGISMEEWLEYAPPESLSLYMYNNPKKAKKLFFDVIPRQMDDYLTHLRKYPAQDQVTQLGNPTWHIHNGFPPSAEEPAISFNLLLNLASACNPEDDSVLWGFIKRYNSNASKETCPMLNNMVHHAVRYYKDFVKPHKQYRTPTDLERNALLKLKEALQEVGDTHDAESLQQIVFDIGNMFAFDPIKLWFKTLYETLLGASQGPRMGSFIALYGVNDTITLIEKTVEK